MAKDLAQELGNVPAKDTTPKERKRPALASPTVNMPEDLSGPCADLLVAENKSFAQYVLPMIVADLKAKKKIAADYKLDLSKRVGGGGFAKLKEANAAKDATIADLQAQLAKLQAGKK
jgi:hypothetical protein